jgi:Na+/melibiose symporter-like transporter
MLWACLVFVWVPWLGPGDFWPFLIICCLSGISLGADLALSASIQADVVDLDWLQSGRRRTGLFFAIWSMATKLSLALAVGLAFPVLDLLGFQASGDNSHAALTGLAVLYGLVPVVIKLAVTALVWNFPISAASYDELRERLDTRPAQPQPLSGSA